MNANRLFRLFHITIFESLVYSRVFSVYARQILFFLQRILPRYVDVVLIRLQYPYDESASGHDIYHIVEFFVGLKQLFIEIVFRVEAHQFQVLPKSDDIPVTGHLYGPPYGHLVGKNARVSGGLMFVEMYKAFGSSPITLPFNETYYR